MSQEDVRTAVERAAQTITPSPAPSGSQLRARAMASRRGRRWRWTAAVGAAAAGLVVVYAAVLAPGEQGGQRPDTAADTAAPVQVPDLTGLTENAARSSLKDAGLALGEVLLIPTEDRPAGSVVQQSPDPGEVADLGDRVDIRVSGGPGSVQSSGSLTITNKRAQTVVVEIARPPAKTLRVFIASGESSTLTRSRVCNYSWLRATTTEEKMVDKYTQPCAGQTWRIGRPPPGICARVQVQDQAYVPSRQQPDIGVGRQLRSGSGTDCDSAGARTLDVYSANEESPADTVAIPYGDIVVVYEATE